MSNQKPSPFSVIPVTPNQSVKVWDFMVPGYKDTVGRVRVLAVVPKRPQPLINIPVSLAWCSPVDINKFSKIKANKILVGRFMKAFEFCERPDYSDFRQGGNVGIVQGPLPSLVGFGVEAIMSTFVPMWVDLNQVFSDEAGDRAIQENNHGC